ncbi:MAG: MBL fold metallo-hydrolase [Hyphomicrobiaceae bacterium]
MTLRFVILGCGSSFGVPRIGNVWGACDPAEPRNRRRRAALLVEKHGPKGITRILIDTPPDLREQLLAANVSELDAVLYTHDHADHTHGIDELRSIVLAAGRRLPTYMDAPTAQSLETRFSYCFASPDGSAYPPILNRILMIAGEPFSVSGAGGSIEVLPLQQRHGDIGSLGFRIGGLAYSPDVSGIPEASVPHLRGLDVWIVDALKPTPHPSHFSVDQALQWIGHLAPKRAILTHLHTDLDYAKLKATLAPHVEPAYDGMELLLET